MRLLRLTLAAAIIVQGVYVKDMITIVLGVALGGLAIANIGCCGTSGCAVDTRSMGKSKNVEYEELDDKK